MVTMTHNLKNGKKITIRSLEAKDGEALASFYESIPPEDEHFYCPHPLTPEYAFANARSAENGRKICLVVENETREIVGYAWCKWENASSPSSVFGICIGGDFKGFGVGSMLMTRLIDRAKETGPPVISLTVQKANPAAVGLYRKMGFEIIREQLRESDQEPEYYMELRI